MDCHEFNENLQVLLDGGAEWLSPVAKKHRESCADCRRLYTQMLQLQRAFRETPRPKLSSQAETLLARRIARQVTATATPVSTPSFWHGLRHHFKALRWERVFLAGGLVAAGLVIIFQLFKPDMTRMNDLRTANDMEILLEEHAMAMDSGIFEGTYQYANLVTTAGPEK